jgi:hypothetical protein
MMAITTSSSISVNPAQVFFGLKSMTGLGLLAVSIFYKSLYVNRRGHFRRKIHPFQLLWLGGRTFANL